MLKFKTFNKDFLEQAVRLTLAEYNEECNLVSELPRKDYTEMTYNLINNMIDHELGVVALDGKNVVGFITCYAPINDFFGNVLGAFSPIHGHGTVTKNRSSIYSLLYQYAAEKWVEKGILSHAIALYAHNTIAIDSFFRNGFGLRCVDAISSINNKGLVYENIENVKMKEIALDEIQSIITLKNNLNSHMWHSPTFYPVTNINIVKYKEQSKERNSRFFIASYENKVVSFIEIKATGENFTCNDSGTINICGAYTYPEFRGRDIFKSLLSFMFEKLKKENYIRCGVDFESINPTADRFWSKYFTPYTYSVVRRIDERINNK